LKVEGKKQCANEHKRLAFCQRLFFVSISAIDGEIRGHLPCTYNYGNLPLPLKYDSKDKEVSSMTIFLYDLLALLPNVKMTPLYAHGREEDCLKNTHVCFLGEEFCDV